MEFNSSEFPLNFRLCDGEEILSVKTFPPPNPKLKPSALRELYRLTSASKKEEVGAHGPAVAALSLESDKPAAEYQGLYDVVFGRDSLRVAINLLRDYPRLARATIFTLAESQGTQFNTTREEEPGRIIHEDRDPDDPIAKRLSHTLDWDWPYYGSVDATPEFIRTLHNYCSLAEFCGDILFERYTDKKGESHHISHALTAAVNWIISRMNQNPEGLLEYKAAFPTGIENQVWKDSWDAYHHQDGMIANHQDGIASIEVQISAYEALFDAADLYQHNLGRDIEAVQLRRRASALGTTIIEKFWTEDKGGYFVLGTDRDTEGNLRQLKIRTSNMGHVLNSRLLEGDDPEKRRKRAAILHQLQSPEMLCIGGIRTLASDEYRFREGAYHNGSVWIWDTHHIANGARRHQNDPALVAFADDLDRRILDVINVLGSFPEYIRGSDGISVNTAIIDLKDSTANGRTNRIEQPPQEVQAWTVAAILATKRRIGKIR